ncbi:MAG: DUF4040 domain-containing protein [Candidatus Aenigmatarchaeota archaeon]|nr:MAG: DUF4040 domain-containing protein [Candidatus Aenigmarchaeota archaeon]
MILEEIAHSMLLIGIVATAVMALRSKDLLNSVIFLAIMSMLLSVEFFALQAPDVAIAEAAVGAGLTTAIYIVTINRTERWEDDKKR